MKFKNKETGEIKSAEARKDGIYLYDKTTKQWQKYKLDLLAKWWEYYEEPTEYWYIDPMVCGIYCTKIKKDGGLYGFNKQIGNYFSSREEAEKAVEKLKAWKRLKDKGFRFKGWKNDARVGYPRINWSIREIDKQVDKDLDTCFGGEE